MTHTDIPTPLADWIVAQAVAGHPPEQALQPLLDQGWNEQDAIDAVEALVRAHIQQHAQANGLPMPVRVPACNRTPMHRCLHWATARYASWSACCCRAW